MATVTLPNGRVRKVKNLGWLLRNWKSVQHIGLYKPASIPLGPTDGSGFMMALMRDGSTYTSQWASLSLAYEWINRPVFRGLWMQLHANGTIYSQIIGEKNLDAIAKKLL